MYFLYNVPVNIIKYRIYSKVFDWQNWASSVDVSNATECGVWSGSTLLTTHSAVSELFDLSMDIVK